VELTSLIRSSQGQSSAILNGRLLAVGEQIDGVSLVEVAADGVTLAYKGKRRFLRTGEHTD
jgi:hypothetical protein